MLIDYYGIGSAAYAFPQVSSSFEALEHPVIALEAVDSKTYGQIKGVFDKVCSHLKFDITLARKVVEFQTAFVNKNEDHVAFFGGVLTGVEVVRFTSLDMNHFFSDVLKINELELEDELHALKSVEAHRNVSGDVFNHSCLWLVHKFLTSNLPDKDAKRAALSSALLLNYRYLTSLLSWYFKFPANPEDAQAAYSRLTKKSAIKQYGSWHALLEARCQDFFPPSGLHQKTVMSYEDDYAIIYALNDSQGRIRSMMKHLMGELIAAKHAGARVRAVSSTVELDGEGFLRDKARGMGTYSQYLFNILADEHTFVKQEIVGILSEALHTAPPHFVTECLVWMSKNYKTSKGKDIDPLITEVLIHSFNYLEGNRNIMRETVGMDGFIMRLKGVYMSSLSTDPRLARIRLLSDNIVAAATTSRNQATHAALRTAIMLYIVVRAFSMNHYSK